MKTEHCFQKYDVCESVYVHSCLIVAELVIYIYIFYRLSEKAAPAFLKVSVIEYLLIIRNYFKTWMVTSEISAI